MPPKSASTSWSRRRTSRTIAQRSTPNDPITMVNSPLSFPSSSIDIVTATATAVSTSSSTFIPPTPQFYRKNLPLNSPITEITPDETPSATFSASQTPLLAPENAIIHLETPRVIGSENGVILSSISQEKDVSSVKAVVGLDSGSNGVERSRKGKRVIVRRTVRVVKRVIKRVPKRVLMIESENQGLEEKAENGVNLTEVKDFNLVNDVIGKSDFLDKIPEKATLVDGGKEISNVVGGDVAQNLNPAYGVIEKYNTVNEIAKTSSAVDDVNETLLKLENNTHVSGSIVGGRGSDQTVIDSMEMETPQTNCKDGVSEPMICEEGNDLSHIDSLDIKTFRINVGHYVPEQMIGEKGNDQSAIYSAETYNMKTNDVMAEVEKELPDSVEVEKVDHAAKSTIESVRNAKIEDSALEDSVIEKQNMDTVSKEDVWLVPCQNAGSVEMENVVSYEGNNGSPRKPESGNDGVECCSVGVNEGLLLSSEMEAFERRKRRKTEIFVGGLDKETKEDDIRKVFEEAGVVLEARLAMSNSRGKNRRFGFVRFATAADAKNALEKYPKVEICGKQCHTELVEGNDTLFIGNIDRKWKTEDVVELLEKDGIEKIDKVTLKADPTNLERNRGFAFVEFQTFRDAQNAFNKLKRKNLFGKNLKIRVAWAQPINEPAEEEFLKVKSVYAEYLPSSWNEGKVEEYFKRFGEIEDLVLAKDLPSSKRNDFAFINYTTRNAALACIMAVSRERSEENGSQVKISVSLAKPFSMSKHSKHASDPTKKQLPKASQATIKLHEPNNGRPASISYDRAKVNTSSSTTEELVQILRQQASSNHIPPRTSIGTITQKDHLPIPGNKRPFQGHDPLYIESRGLPKAHLESSYLVSGPSALSHIARVASFPYHRQGPSFTAESDRRNIYPSHYQTREQNPYYGNNNIYRRY